MKKQINIKTASKLYEELQKYSHELKWYKDRNSESPRRDYDEKVAYYVKVTHEAREAFENEATRLLSGAIDEAQKRASVRTITAPEIVEKLQEIQDYLNIPKKALEGVRVLCDIHAQNFPGAYNGTPESTQFTAVFKSGSWRVDNIRRDATCRASKSVIVRHTDESRAALISRFTQF